MLHTLRDQLGRTPRGRYRSAIIMMLITYLVCSETRDHNLSILMPGWYRLALLGWTWKFLIPTFPKYPGWYLSKLILKRKKKHMRYRYRSFNNQSYYVPVVMLATSVSTTSRMLPVLSNPTMSVGDMSSQLTGLLLSCGHFSVLLLKWRTEWIFDVCEVKCKKTMKY